MKLSRKKLSRICVDSFIGCWTLAYSSSPRRILWQQPDVTLFSTGAHSNFQNGVLKARFTKSNVAARTKKTLEYFQRRRLPMVWLVDPYSTPAGLGRHLEGTGMICEWGIPCMAMDLAKVRRQARPPGLTIRPVSDIESLRVCVNTAKAGFDEGKRIPGDPWHEVYISLGFSPAKQWFTGFLNGKPVASSLLLLQGGLATVWIVATLKEARGRGIGTAMTREALLSAKRLGYDFAVIQSSKLGLPIYEKMGFVEYSKIEKFVWNPE